ncbi:hypothetical protein GCM10027068_00480 [Prescottella soli]
MRLAQYEQCPPVTDHRNRSGKAALIQRNSQRRRFRHAATLPRFDIETQGVVVDEMADEHFLAGGMTWAELKPTLYPGNTARQ